MKIIIKIIILFKAIIAQPLSILRFSLSILMGKYLLERLNDIYSLENISQYALSKTWFLKLLPDSFLTLDISQYNILKYSILISALCAAIGFLGRLNLLILAFLCFYIFGIGEGIGVFDHHASLPSQVIFALALVPGSMKLSLDYLFLYIYYKQKRWNLNFKDNPKWGLNLILMLLVLTYFAAGASKLRYGKGTSWMDGSTLGFYLKERTFEYSDGDSQLIIGDNKISKDEKWKDKYGFIAHTYGNFQSSKKMNAVADYIANNKVLIIALSIGSVLFELFGFIVFFNSKYRNLYLISAIIFHMSIGSLMGISFRQYRLICFCLIDWVSFFNFLENRFKQFSFYKQLSKKVSS